MRLRVIILLMVVTLAFAGASADTIHLKNGRTIVADQVREKGNHLEYDIGEDTYAISKSSSTTSKPAACPRFFRQRQGRRSPAFTPADSLANEGDLVAKIVKEGKVDPDALAGPRSQRQPRTERNRRFHRRKIRIRTRQHRKGPKYFENALRFQPKNSTILIYYAALLVRTGSAAQALPYAQRAVQALTPDSPTPSPCSATRSSPRTTPKTPSPPGSVRWNCAPTPRSQQMLAKAQREEKVETDFAQHESSHFVLHYEGNQTSETLSRVRSWPLSKPITTICPPISAIRPATAFSSLFIPSRPSSM